MRLYRGGSRERGWGCISSQIKDGGGGYNDMSQSVMVKYFTGASQLIYFHEPEASENTASSHNYTDGGV